MDQLKKLFESIGEFWKRQTKKAKTVIISVGAFILVLSIVLTLILNNESYTTLYSGLDSTQAAEIITELQSMGIESSITSGGAISVPKEQMLSIQMQLAVKGYPRDTVNYDVWDESINMFSTDYDKREISRRQTETRLTATYKTLAGVKDAIVSLDIPQIRDTVINDNQDEATASVVLHLKAGYDLSSSELIGIKNIAAGAVSTLTADNVIITDGTGALLTADDDDEVDEVQKLNFKTQYEELLKEKITELLIPFFGKEGIVVGVDARLNYDKQLTDIVEYTPSNGDGTGMVDDKENSGSIGGNIIDDGVVGTDPNADDVPNYPTIEFAETGEGYYDWVTKTHYLVNTRKQQIEKSGYAVDDITISVSLNKEEMELGEREQISELVAYAAGTKVDSVMVFNNTFLKPGEVINPGTDDIPLVPQWTLEQLLLYGGVALGILVLVILVLMLITRGSRKRRRLRRKQALLAQQQEKDAKDNSPFNIPIKQDFNIPSLSEASRQDTKESVLKREIGEFAMTSPEIAAQLIRGWLKEEDY